MYQLKITAKAKKQLKEISKVYLQKAIYTALEDIKEDPFLGKPLIREFTGKCVYKVGVYRIIYKINKQDKKVYIIDAGHRSTVYN